jgi:DNA-binding MarR family transcriptional regulator
MSEFVQLPDGLIAEKGAHDLAAWYARQDPHADSLALEAYILVLKAYTRQLSSGRTASRIRFSAIRFNILRLLYQTEGRKLLMSEIGQGLSVSPTNITKFIDGLVDDGLVRRTSDPSDKRKRWAELTAAGARTLEADLPIVTERVRQMWEGLSAPEKRQLVHLLSKFVLSFPASGQPAVEPAGAPRQRRRPVSVS